MQIAVLTFDGFNELDSFIAAGILNRMKPKGWAAHITSPTEQVTSMNGVTITRQRPLSFAGEADAVDELGEELSIGGLEAAELHLLRRDGEGARKLVEVVVEGATSKASARKIAMSIANSPLVKTAIAGEDANWGRVVMAVGKAGEPANRDKLSISFNGIRVAKSGARDPSYNETEVSEAMKAPKIQIKVALGLGKGRDRVLTCDLTKEYVAINGDYRS